MSKIIDVLTTRKRMFIGLGVGTAVALLIPGEVRPVSRALVGWNVAVYLYLAMIWFMMMRADHRAIQALAKKMDETALVVLTMVCGCAIVSIVAIVLELANVKDIPEAHRAFHYALTAVTVVGSWLLVPTVFALHYGHMFYITAKNERPLAFPDKLAEPDYWDFLYFSLTIAVASQTADVACMSRSMRKAVMSQSVLSFFFNASILALSINIAASLVGS